MTQHTNMMKTKLGAVKNVAAEHQILTSLVKPAVKLNLLQISKHQRLSKNHPDAFAANSFTGKFAQIVAELKTKTRVNT